ncbi:MAG: ABC transporter ATP-binding protein [Clostridia bacterium]|nr:ABC transporter ATP-binding protein [Clostridia bacterium]
MYAIETYKLTKVFSGYKAVNELDLKVPMGSIYGFLGPNGAGKTTTIKMLTGLSKPESGKIKICGREVSFGSVKNREEIGYLPDVPSFYNWMYPEEFLIFSGELLGMDRRVIKNKIEELLELVGLSDVKKKIGGFSRGMKQRLGIAQALISNPKVVFLDEPTSALDPIGRKEVMDIIQKLSGKVTVFFSTHILSDIERVCDRVIILDKGKAIIEDTLDNLRREYSMRLIALEVENATDIEKTIGIVKEQKYISSIKVNEENEIRLSVADMREAQLKIPGILSGYNIPLKKFCIIEPSLEEIFIKVVNRQ